MCDLDVQDVTPTLFIPSQHPNFDVSFGQLFYGLRHAVLQLVLHSRRSQQLKPTELPSTYHLTCVRLYRKLRRNDLLVP